MPRTIFHDAAVNTAVAASAIEIITSAAANRGQYAPFNKLEVINRGNVDITIRLDGTNDPEHNIPVPANTIMKLEPNEGITFKWFENVNSSKAAQVAGAIDFKWSKVI
jgi:hypothetical protein|tara:strand:- start:1955 stop:2278 length:324 start_codon:yes stop_codon:yes gene_type:complete